MTRAFSMFVAIAVAVWLGCGKADRSGQRTVGGANGSQPVAAATPADEEQDLGGDALAEKPLPDGFPRELLFPGGRVFLATKMGPTGASISFTTVEPSWQVLEFFERKLKGGAWKFPLLSITTGEGMIHAESPGGEKLAITSGVQPRMKKATTLVVYTLPAGVVSQTKFIGSSPAAAQPSPQATFALPDDCFAKDVAFYPGATPTGRGCLAETIGVIFRTADPPEKVLDFYRNRLPADGWQLGPETKPFDRGAVLTATKEQRELRTTVRIEKGQTLIDLSLTPKRL